MAIEQFLERLRAEPHTVEFADTMAVIEAAYDYTPVTFLNGAIVNGPGQNAGSCRLFAFARMHGLTESETLACFGHYYRVEVLDDPEGAGHANIRQFMQSGWAGIHFEHCPLRPKVSA